MTTLDTAPVPVVAISDDNAPPPGSGDRRRRRLVIAAVGTAVLVGLLIALFNGPVAQLWYQSRQEHLVHDYGVARSRTRAGEALANLQIPTIGLNVVVGEGDSPGQLRAGPGHRIGTPVPGALGNSLIFGHRRGWGGSFADLGKLHPGDQIFIQARLGQPTLFSVTSVSLVSVHTTGLLSPSTDHRVTLVTAIGGGLMSNRLLVVTAVSGTPGKLLRPSRPVRATATRGSVIFNRTTGLFLVLVLGAVAAVRGLKVRYRRLTVALVVAPLVASAVLALLLELDLLLPPLH